MSLMCAKLLNMLKRLIQTLARGGATGLFFEFGFASLMATDGFHAKLQLTDNNYADWFATTRAFLGVKEDIDEALEYREEPIRVGDIDFIKPEDVDEDEITKAKKAYDVLLRSTSGIYRCIVRNAASPSGAWKYLREHYLIQSDEEIARLQRKVMTVKMPRGSDPQITFTMMLDWVGQMATMGHVMSEQVLEIAMLDSLDDDYQITKHYLQHHNKSERSRTTSQQAARSRYFSLQREVGDRGESGSALAVRTVIKAGRDGSRGTTGHRIDPGTTGSRSRGLTKAREICDMCGLAKHFGSCTFSGSCYSCGKIGHQQAVCPQRRASLQRKASPQRRAVPPKSVVSSYRQRANPLESAGVLAGSEEPAKTGRKFKTMLATAADNGKG
ncbi:unnamed protein product [Choristocarpus tenellus]